MRLPAALFAIAIVLPAAAQAQDTRCTPEFSHTAAREKTRGAAEATLEREVAALMAQRYGANSPYTLAAGIAARSAVFSCARDGGGLACTVKGRICVPEQRAPDCAGNVMVDAVKAGDRCGTSTVSGSSISAGISPLSCPAGYDLTVVKGPDYCKLR